MRPLTRSRPSLLPRLLLAGAVVMVGCFGCGATLMALGVIPSPFGRVPQALSHEGRLAVPLSGQRVPMYTKVTRDFLFDPKTSTLSLVWLRPNQIKPNMLTNPDQIIGRVTSHDKPVGYVFTEEDFFPKGTQPGIVAGIPPGKRSLTLEADKLHGIRDMQAGDRFDVLSSLAIDSKPVSGSLGIISMPGTLANSLKRAAVRALVQNGVIVSPVTTRLVPVSSTGLTSGLQTRMKPIQEITIAVDPKEIAPLSEALAIGADILCVARSGRPEERETTSNTPGLQLPQRKTIEVLSGSKRHVVAFPAEGNGLPEVTELEPRTAPEDKKPPEDKKSAADQVLEVKHAAAK